MGDGVDVGVRVGLAVTDAVVVTMAVRGAPVRGLTEPVLAATHNSTSAITSQPETYQRQRRDEV